MKFIIQSDIRYNRLWSISEDYYSNQFLNLYDKYSLLQNVYKLVLSLTNEKNILTITNSFELMELKNKLQNFGKLAKFITVPIMKNTAASIFAALSFLQGKKDEIIVILPPDFSIKSIKIFEEALEEAQSAAKKGYIVLLGTKSLTFDYGFDYVQIDKTTTKTKQKSGKTINPVVPVLKFFGNPDKTQLDELSKSKNCYYSTGIYVSKLSILFSELCKYSPEFNELDSGKIFYEQDKIDDEYYKRIPDISIESAIIEKTDKLAFVELRTKWENHCSWNKIYDNNEKDSEGNIKEGNVILNKVKDSLVYSSCEFVTLDSVKNLLVTNTENTLFICDRNRNSDINKLINNDNNISQHKTVLHDWGICKYLSKGIDWNTKLLTIYPEHKLGNNFQEKTNKHILILEGNADIIINDEQITLTKGQSINIPNNTNYSLQNNTKEILKILETTKDTDIAESKCNNIQKREKDTNLHK